MPEPHPQSPEQHETEGLQPWATSAEKALGEAAFGVLGEHLGEILTPELIGKLAVQLSQVEIPKLAPDTSDLIGTTQAGKMLGVTRQRVYQMRQYGHLPEPVGVTENGPIWTRSSIQDFIASRTDRRRSRD